MGISNRRRGSTAEDPEGIIKSVKDSGCFGRSTRQLRLFEYLLTHSIAGTFSDVTQYSLALDVLDRSEDFDTASDSIVRVEMHRLRTNLKTYNSGDFDYTIDVPAASFQVVVKSAKQSAFSEWKISPLSAMLATLLMAATFCVGYALPDSVKNSETNSCSELVPNLKIEYVGEPSDAQTYVENVLRSAIAQQTSFYLLSKGETCTSDAAPLFAIQFTILERQGQFNLAIEVLDLADDTVVDSHHIAGVVSETYDNSQLYYKIVKTANSITMPNSVPARFAYKSKWSSEDNQTSYGCLIAMNDSYSGALDNEFVDIHSCLEASVEGSLAALDNYGALASSYLEKARVQKSKSAIDSLNSAKRILGDYGDDWINSNEIAIARIYYEFSKPDFSAERMDLILTSTQARYNTNPQVLLLVSTFYGYSLGRWSDAKNISDHVMHTYSTRDQSVFEVDAGYAFLNYAELQSVEPCFKLYSENSIYVNILVNACAYLSNEQSWIDATEANLARLNVTGVDQKMAFLATRIHDRRFMSKIRKVLEEAEGL